MAQFTEEHFLAAVSRIKEAFSDGFQFADVAVVIKEVTVFADLFALEGSEKRALAIRVAERVIDETDTPWIPDALVDPLLKKVVPKLIDLVVDATRGKLEVNKPASGTSDPD